MEQKITKKDIKDYWVNDGPKLVFVVLWVLANIGICSSPTSSLFTSRKHHIHQLTSFSVVFAERFYRAYLFILLHY